MFKNHIYRHLEKDDNNIGVDMVRAQDGNIVEVGGKYFLGNSWLVTITHIDIRSDDRAIIGWVGFTNKRAKNSCEYNMAGEYIRSDFGTENEYDIMTLHSYKRNNFARAINMLENQFKAS